MNTNELNGFAKATLNVAKTFDENDALKHIEMAITMLFAEREAQVRAEEREKARGLVAYVEAHAKLDGDEPERWLEAQGFSDWMELPKFVEEARALLATYNDNRKG